MSGNKIQENFFIRADDHLISVGNDSLVAFEVLIKMHYIFDLKFAADLESFYNFIVSCVMQLKGVIIGLYNKLIFFQ